MSKKTDAKKTRAPQPSATPAATPPCPAAGKAMKGADILVACLEREGVEVIFAYPGGASMEIHQSLTRSEQIRTILCRHEQGGAFMAGGYGRATGKAGVCMSTSGPGATNLVSGIADAYMDSIPLVAITGQVPQAMIGKTAFQETDVFGMTLPLVKHSYLITDINELPRIVKEAFHVAQTGRPGPVVIDVPKNIQQGMAVPVFPEAVNMPGYAATPVDENLDAILAKLAALISKSERPLIYCGGGIISSGAHKELLEFAEKTQIPVTTTLMGCGGFPETHPLSLKWLGMHGTVYANWAADNADLLIAIGVRFDDRVTSKVSEFCKHGTIVHIDIDPSEINKNKAAHLAAVADVRMALAKLNKIAKTPAHKFKAWRAKIAQQKAKYPLRYKVTDEVLRSKYAHDFLKGDASQIIMPQFVIEQLCELTQGEAIIATGVGQHQMWSGQYYTFTHPRTFLTSGGLGAMGFGWPAAIGAKVAHPEKQVIDIDGDGSFLMNVQEMATAHIERIAAKAIILNNQHLGMVVQWEDRFYKSNRGHTYLGDPRNPHNIYPDYVRMAQSFNVPAERVLYKKDVRPALQRMLASKEPYVLDMITPYTEHVLPMIPANTSFKSIIVE
jgi:acetolactate synthase-1/2/3 large subunit